VNALRRRLLPLSWFALVAALALALLPGLSRARAFAAGEPTPWRAICTSQGGEPGAARADGERPAAGHMVLEHCAYCGLSAGDALLPAQPVSCAGPAAARTTVAIGEVRGPLSHRTWHALQARAPPVST